jgi:hypothetical protein
LLRLPQTSRGAFLNGGHQNENPSLPLEIDLNHLPQRKKFLAQ